MEYNSSFVDSKRKVTLSCRVLPEQKLLIAEKAKEFEMSLSQYVEAKILRDDTFSLEKKIEEQRLALESLKTQMELKLAKKDEYIEKLKTFYGEKVKNLEKEIQGQKNQTLVRNDTSFVLPFSDSKHLQLFHSQLQILAKKHGFDLTNVLKMCVRYTLKNDKSQFFLERVSEFVKNNYSN